MKKLKRIIKYIFLIIALIGFVIVLGTAGASDLEKIPFNQIIVNAGIGMTMFVGGFLGVITLMEDDYYEG